MTDLAIHGGRVVTMVDGTDEIIGCVIIRGGRIERVNPIEECQCEASGTDIIDATGKIVLPGFVDGHRHTWQTALRLSMVGVSMSVYGQNILMTAAPKFTAEDIHIGNLLGALTAIDSGVTTMVDWSHALNTPAHADAAVEALLSSGIRGQFAYGIPRTGTPDWSRNSSLAHPKDLKRIHDSLPSDSRVTVAMAARGIEMSNADVVNEDMRFARELGIRISMHVGAVDLGRMRAVEQLKNAGLLADDINFIHLNSTADDELDMIADAGAGACVGAKTEIIMDPGTAWPITGRLLRHGLKPALSVDTETGSSGSMFEEMRGAIMGVAAEADAPELSAAEVLELATSAGADAIGMGAVSGRLAPGLAGDVILVDANAVNLMPARNAADTVVLAGHAGNVDTVVIDGIVRKRNGVLVGQDLAALAERVAESAARLLP
ncbi:MAG: hypothetical protein JWN80_2954 [Microbacteriaceae bacterium]|nr:hypothetical protein [Microbacteriaceae bacterium]